MRTRFTFVAACLAAIVFVAWASPASAQFLIETKDGKANLKIGFLAQPMWESLSTADGVDTSNNLFLRRFRILFGGKLNDKWTYFFETDNPNLGKGTGTAGTKDTGTLYFQDAFVTYNHNAAFRVDVGMILPATTHQHIQSAATLLPVDYGPYSFLESTPIGARVGRDYGVQLRGIPGGHFEYRLGIYEGLRGTNATNGMRFVGRGTWFPFAAETGFFYTGTFQGSKKMVAVGASFDKQDDYGNYGVDFFSELPINKGEQGLTFQAAWNRINGGTFLTTLPQQDVVYTEVGLHLGKGKATPFLQYSKHTYDVPTATYANQHAFQAGVAFWLNGHNQNLKISYGKQHTDGLPDRNQFLAQLQIFYY